MFCCLVFVCCGLFFLLIVGGCALFVVCSLSRLGCWLLVCWLLVVGC